MKHFEIDTKKDLANYIRCDVDFLEKAINDEYFVSDSKEGKFDVTQLLNNIVVTRFYVKKKGKKRGVRTVHKIRASQLENALKILNNNLTEIYTANKHIHGFVKGRTIKSNAECHLAKKYILSVDIENYFESINKDLVVRSLIKLGFKDHVAQWISNIVTLNNSLVQGFHTSPTIANIVTEELDQNLVTTCADTITYSRYADDLYFSSENNDLPLDLISEQINEYGFNLNPEKTKLMIRGKKQYVTGLTVFDNIQPRISKKKKRNIRLEIYYIKKFGYKKHVRKKLINAGNNPKEEGFKNLVNYEIEQTINRLYGWLHFINSIEPVFATKYYSKLKKSKVKYYR